MAKKLLAFVLMLFLGSLTAHADWLSRYWDGCKPSCSWSGKPTAPGMGVCKECNKQDQLMSPTSDNNRSACDGGSAYTCWDMSPVAVSSTLAYGFVASNPSKMSCGSCYELTFTGQGEHGSGPSHQALVGKKMIVMASNIGGDVANDQFDLLVPGGGVGAFDAFSNQINKSKNDLGAQYGGLLTPCPNHNAASVADNQSCLKTKCASVFSGQPKLKAGCDFYADWLMAANNPKFTSRSIDCPDYLKTAYKQASGNPPSSSNSVASSSSAASITLTVTRNPANIGSTTPASSQTNIAAGTPVNISASASSGHAFTNWTVTSGSPTIANANSATTTVTLYGNAAIRANFTQIQTATYVLTVTRNPTAGGTTTPASSSSVTAGTPVSISASASSGYKFNNWTVVSGNATFANANSATTTVTLTSAATIRANFTTSVSSSSGGNQSSSSKQLEGNTGDCITPPGVGPPPNGIETCIVVSGKCYTCNQDRGQECSSEWLWSGGQVSESYWFTQVGCPGGSSSSTASSSSSSAGSGSINWSGTGTLKIEAEDYVSKEGRNMVTSTANGITNIGYIENGYSTTYKVNMTAAGTFPMDLRIATGQSSNFTVWVNNTQVGTVTRNGTDWDAYSTVRLTPNVSLKQGENTIELRFQTPVNVDYFEFISSIPASSSSGGSSSSGTTPVILPQTHISNLAQMQANGIYLQVMNNARLELFDLRGKSVKKMNFSNGVHSVQLNDLPKGLYIAKVSFGSEKKILRIPIR